MDFNYKKICSDLLKSLSTRTANVIERRFGLKLAEKETLESIGGEYGITRERVRQIEEEGLSKIRQKIKEQKELQGYFEASLASFGGAKKESSLLEFLGGKKLQNHVFFLLSSFGNFGKSQESEEFYPLWYLKNENLESAKKIVKSAVDYFGKEKKVVSLDELYSAINADSPKEVFVSFIEASKEIQKNPEDKFGLRNWLEINPKGVRDKAYLVFKKEAKPLHFSMVAGLIEKLPFICQRKVHVATVHNELIKDNRFVLVGRGLYALSEWGYTPGVVKDIIIKTIKESQKPLSKDEIIAAVLKQRVVKANTVFLNLQDKNYFTKTAEGNYTVKEA
jgi:hypothetical protein